VSNLRTPSSTTIAGTFILNALPHVPLTPEQNKALSRVVKDLKETLATLRKYPLQDGGSEPGTLFAPVPDRH
jgi:hypothetical protein